ncbi:hypothetical protein WKI13_12095 [Teredinibacter turnerae]|uniref:SLOG cluster 4 domain-containing protein n=1 Tax=Teredinibacter turnerae TaxID=2426 RepID=UPI001E302998|nr:hypothetical protein [Teredinibacter turnerae]
MATEKAYKAGGHVVSIIPIVDINMPDWLCATLVPCGMGDAQYVMMALAGDTCLVIGSLAGTISEVCLVWLHKLRYCL